MHSGYVEVLHNGEFGSICTTSYFEVRSQDNLVARVVCRQLGFPYATRVDPLTPLPQDQIPPRSTFEGPVEAEEPEDRFWLYDGDLECRGPEERLVDCDVGAGFTEASNERCLGDPTYHRLHVACRQFPVPEALEGVTTPGAGSHTFHISISVPQQPVMPLAAAACSISAYFGASVQHAHAQYMTFMMADDGICWSLPFLRPELITADPVAGCGMKECWVAILPRPSLTSDRKQYQW